MSTSRFILFRDDDTGLWCAAPPGFRSALTDPVGWGETAAEAVQALVGGALYRSRTRTSDATPTLRDFTMIPAPLVDRFRTAG